MSTSKLQKKISELLSENVAGYTIKENYRPPWLITPRGERLELDFYIEELAIAIEVQGIQHFKFSSFFHGSMEDFEAQVRRDIWKKEKCISTDVTFFDICSEEEVYPILEIMRQSPLPPCLKWRQECRELELLQSLVAIQQSKWFKRLRRRINRLYKVHNNDKQLQNSIMSKIRERLEQGGIPLDAQDRFVDRFICEKSTDSLEMALFFLIEMEHNCHRPRT